ncbi:hypothetical protein ACG2QI_01270 [Bacillus sp. GM2]|nr:hypothetical protein [Bacillus paralicheniformis]TWM58928.1 hypothetical protein CHCC14814_1117 [Bacillus paralicheniformis]
MKDKTVLVWTVSAVVYVGIVMLVYSILALRNRYPMKSLMTVMF